MEAKPPMPPVFVQVMVVAWHSTHVGVMQGGWDRIALLPIALVSRPIIPVSVLAMVHVLSITSASVKVDTEDTSARELLDHFENCHYRYSHYKG